ncbi:MAG: hypothetical protein QG646_449 [Euryarchaeota archaeon]|nr:hypothetical protein [Euryarchaeota archaeon]
MTPLRLWEVEKPMNVNMKILIGFMTTLASIAILASVVPSIGSNIETSMPVNETSSYADAQTGGSLWNSGMTALTGVVGLGGILIILNWLGLDLFGKGSKN